MKKVLNLVFAFSMILSVVFIGDVASSSNPFAAQAQTRVTVKRKHSGGLYGKSKRGVKYVYRKSKHGVVYVGRKSYQGGKWVGKKTVHGSKWIYRKGKRVVVGH